MLLPSTQTQDKSSCFQHCHMPHLKVGVLPPAPLHNKPPRASCLRGQQRFRACAWGCTQSLGGRTVLGHCGHHASCRGCWGEDSHAVWNDTALTWGGGEKPVKTPFVLSPHVVACSGPSGSTGPFLGRSSELSKWPRSLRH